MYMALSWLRKKFQINRISTFEHLNRALALMMVILKSHRSSLHLKGYCVIFQHALKSLEITGIVLILNNAANCKEKILKVKKL